MRRREAIEVARRYADGQATNDELAVAWATTWAAAWAAERRWQAARLLTVLGLEDK